MFNVAELRVASRVKRVGNSIAFFIPAAQARRVGIREGQLVEAHLRTEVPSPFGLLADLPYRPFRREAERDRI